MLTDLLKEIYNAIETDRPTSPTEWLGWAIKLTKCWLEIKNDMTQHFVTYKSEVSVLIEEGKKISEADRIVEGKSEHYQKYLYLKARDEVVEEMIRLCKKKASLEINTEL